MTTTEATEFIDITDEQEYIVDYTTADSVFDQNSENTSDNWGDDPMTFDAIKQLIDDWDFEIFYTTPKGNGQIVIQAVGAIAWDSDADEVIIGTAYFHLTPCASLAKIAELQAAYDEANDALRDAMNGECANDPLHHALPDAYSWIDEELWTAKASRGIYS